LLDIDPVSRTAQARSVAAITPMVLAALHRAAAGMERHSADLARGHAASYLHAVTGVEPIDAHVRALEQYLILTIDHGFNASTFTGRVVASTGADLGASLVAGYGALTGPRHGAVQNRVLEMLDEVASPERAEAWMKATIADRRHVMGFGHAVYTVGDPRAVVLREVATEVAPERARVAIGLEDAAERVFAGRRIAANVDLYAAAVLEGCGIPPELLTPTFAVARIVGWCAHVLEQAEERKIIRPGAHYVGPPPR
jgi:citrate synthase